MPDIAAIGNLIIPKAAIENTDQIAFGINDGRSALTTKSNSLNLETIPVGFLAQSCRMNRWVDLFAISGLKANRHAPRIANDTQLVISDTKR